MVGQWSSVLKNLKSRGYYKYNTMNFQFYKTYKKCCYHTLNKAYIYMIFICFVMFFISNMSYIYIIDGKIKQWGGYNNTEYRNRHDNLNIEKNKELNEIKNIIIRDEVYKVKKVIDEVFNIDWISEREKEELVKGVVYAEMITGVPSLLLIALAKTESDFLLSASNKKYKSVLQTPLASSKWYSVDILIGAEILREKLNRSNGDLKVALAMYKGGHKKKVARKQAVDVIKIYNKLNNLYSFYYVKDNDEDRNKSIFNYKKTHERKI